MRPRSEILTELLAKAEIDNPNLCWADYFYQCYDVADEMWTDSVLLEYGINRKQLEFVQTFTEDTNYDVEEFLDVIVEFNKFGKKL